MMTDERFIIDVVRHRRWVRIALRACVAVLVFVGVRWAAHWAGWVLSNSGAGSGWDSYGLTIGFYFVTAVILVLCEPTIVKWVVPYEAGGCLGCGYPAQGAERCPECGLPIPEQSGAGS